MNKPRRNLTRKQRAAKVRALVDRLVESATPKRPAALKI